MASEQYEYISKEMVKGQFELFLKKTLGDIEQKIGQKYPDFSKALIHPIAVLAYVKLSTALYLECAFSEGFPSVRQQMNILSDFAQLLEREDAGLKYFNERTPYWECYSTIRSLLYEKNSFDKSGAISEAFFKRIRVNKENIPPHQIGLYMACAQELTSTIMLDMMATLAKQIIKKLPSHINGQDETYLASLIQKYKDSIETAEPSIDNALSNKRRVTFSLD